MNILLRLFARCTLYILFTAIALGQTLEKRKIALDDFSTLRDVNNPQISPDGRWVAYTVRTPDMKEDKRSTDIWMTSWDGAQTMQLTFSKESEHSPRWSPDNKYLAFLSSRGVEGETDQLWLLNRSGGEAQKITDVKGSVVDYAWSPDGKRIALVVADIDTTLEKDKAEKKPPKPIVIDRFQFKHDETGYLLKLRQHMYLFDVATRKAEILTPGPFNEYLPSWSPDGSTIAFVSKRGEDFDRHENYDIYLIEAKASSAPRQLTTYEGADAHPDWESRPEWSPDGKFIAYLQGGPKELFYYAVNRLALVSAAGGPPKILAPELDRNCSKPSWSSDGKSIYFLLEDNRSRHLAKVSVLGGKPEILLNGRHEIRTFDVGVNDRIVFLSSTPQEPFELFALEKTKTRQLTQQNQELLSKLKLAAVDEISFRSKDGTEVDGFFVKPPDYESGKKYPTILWIHGGPVAQFSNQFAFQWQLFAAQGYAVVAANPRGSSGRGEVFSTAIFADWGNKDAQDVLAAVDYVVAQGFADPNRLAIGGWSYGGMLTNYTIAQDTRFKAAVSGASTSNILAGYGTDMYVREYELELGVPWKNPDGWLKVSFPFLHADRIVTPTLFLCGEKDFNVPLLNSEQMYQALRSLGRETKLVIYPGQYHDISRPSYQRDRWERYLHWYGKFLKSGGEDSK